MAQKPSIPKGTRDFLPEQVAKRTYIFDTIKNVFKLYGFDPIETPSFEMASTLLGKYGEEGDRLIFRILNSGEKMRKADLQALEEGNLPRFANSLAEKALRYDLTVPFARFVVQHQHELTFPFKRYQIQPVWRADRPQHGRYQEFYQCDADVVGSDSLLFEVDFVSIFNEVLTQLQLPAFTILINNRKILSGIAEVCGEEDRIIEITVAIDKLDKIGVEGVINELLEKGLSPNTIDRIRPLFQFSGTTEEKLTFMTQFLSGSEIGMKGIEELTYVLERVGNLQDMKANVVFDFTLARGLNYYTGAIFEVKADGVKMGSICGGGRYDDLTGLFGVSGLSGIGISFGADRIYDVLEELQLFPKSLSQSLQLLFVNFGSSEQDQCIAYCQQLRKRGVSCEVYPAAVKMQKQMKYANDRNVPFVAMVGEEELKNGIIRLKNMQSGEQQDLSIELLISQVKQV